MGIEIYKDVSGTLRINTEKGEVEVYKDISGVYRLEGKGELIRSLGGPQTLMKMHENLGHESAREESRARIERLERELSQIRVPERTSTDAGESTGNYGGYYSSTRTRELPDWVLPVKICGVGGVLGFMVGGIINEYSKVPKGNKFILSCILCGVGLPIAIAGIVKLVQFIQDRK